MKMMAHRQQRRTSIEAGGRCPFSGANRKTLAHAEPHRFRIRSPRQRWKQPASCPPSTSRLHADGVVSFHRAGGAYESHLRTAGIAGRTKRCGGGVAARGARSKPAMRVMATPCSRRRRSAVDNRHAICKSLGNLAGRDALLIDRRGDAGRHLGQTADVAQADGRWQASMML